jgi:hypothetical protein
MTKIKITNLFMLNFFLLFLLFVCFGCQPSTLAEGQKKIDIKVTDSASASAVIVSPASDLTINQGKGVVFLGKSSDPKLDKITCHWHFGANSGLADSASCNAGEKIFSNPGAYKVVLTVMDVSSGSQLDVATVTIKVNTLVDNKAPNGVILAPSSTLSINKGQSVSFNGSGADTHGDSYTCLWNFGSGSGIVNSSSCNAGLKIFNNVGTFTVSFKVTDSKGLSDPNPASLKVTVNAATVNRAPNGFISMPLSKKTWSLVYVSSEETVKYDEAAINAFDGDPNTRWFTRWSENQLSLPQEIKIDLGSSYRLTAWTYLPMQNTNQNGRIKGYEFYVSESTSSWGSPAAKGEFTDYSTLAEKVVPFAVPVQGRYIRLVVLSEIRNHASYVSAAEIGVIASEEAHERISVIKGAAINFSGIGIDPDGDAVTCHWSFGAGSGIADSTSCDAGLKVFNDKGHFTVTLTIKDSKGLVDPTPAIIVIDVDEIKEVINKSPNGTISSPSSNMTVSSGSSISFNGQGVDPDGDAMTCLWNFDSGSGIADSTSCNAGTKVFKNVGTFEVIFTVKDSKGLSDPTPAKVVVTVKSTTTASPIIWRGDYETGNFLQWHNLAKTPAPNYSQIPIYGRPAPDGDGSLLKIVTSPVRQGKYAAKFTVKNSANGTEPNDCDVPFPTCSRRRTELTGQGTQPLIYNAMPYMSERWISVSYFIPSDWDNGGSGFGIHLLQIKPLNDGAGPTIAINIRSGMWTIEHRWSSVVNPSYGSDLPWQQSMYYSYKYPIKGVAPLWDDGVADFVDPKTSQQSLGDLNKGGWTDWIIHVKYDARGSKNGGTGFLKFWKRAGSGPWIPVLDIRPKVISRGGMTFDRGIGYNSPAQTGKFMSGYPNTGGFGIKAGMYMDKNQVWGLSANRVMYNDNIKIGNQNATFSDMIPEASP